MGYRPITDVWILARSKVKFFGAYPAGFLQRARDLLACGTEDQVLHACSGKVRDYPYKGFGLNDLTMDLDPEMKPDYIGDASELLTYQNILRYNPQIHGVLADPPYTEAFARAYAPGPEHFVTGDEIVKHSIAILPVGGRVGVLSLGWPRYPKANARQIAIIGVVIGNGNLGRWFAVYEKTTEMEHQ